jgi:hypothetical protein
MKKLSVAFFLLFLCSGLFSQVAPVDVVLTIRDKRYSDKNAIAYTSLFEQIAADLKSRNYHILEQGASASNAANAIFCEIVIDFLNFYESESNNMFGKGMVSMVVKNFDNSFNQTAKTSVDNPYKELKLRNKDNPRFKEQFTKTEEDIQRQLSNRIIDKIIPQIDQAALQIRSKIASADNRSNSRQELTNNSSAQYSSDVDVDIPVNSQINTNRFALIIGNEDYSSFQLDLSTEVNVKFASHDAKIFREYVQRTLGVPEKNIVFLINGTLGQMNQAISKISLIIKNTSGEAEICVYYAGHGMPDEVTKEAYIMPVDVSAKNITSAIKLKDFYAKLNEYPSKRVTVFIDACFSGGARNQGMLAARGVRITPKEDLVTGKMVVFTASSGDQSSLPYADKNHGMFTYFLLKKIKESKGQVSYKELSEYLGQKVGLESVVVNSKEQTTQTLFSNEVSAIWGNWILTGK